MPGPATVIEPAPRAVPGAVAPSWPRAVLGAAVVAFIALTASWLARDSRVPVFDAGAHMYFALHFRDGFGEGDPFRWLTYFQSPGYPPFVHLVGMVGTWIAGTSVATFVLTSNVVFVPLLAIGCYGAGTLAYDERVGAAAAVFALGTPMILSLFHVFMLDAPLTALVAGTVWLVLLSRRFERVGPAAAAGALAGLGMLTKNTYAVYVAGFLAVVLLRGGWRNWRGIVAFLAVGAVICGPWYLIHLRDLLEYAGGGNVGGTSELGDPGRFSYEGLSWYLWAAVDNQAYLPLSLLVLVGVVLAAVRLARGRAEGPVPELLAGAVFTYVVIDLFSHKDARYTLPALVYVAILATAWFVRSRHTTVRVAGGTFLAVFAVWNALSIGAGVGPTARIVVDDSARTSFASRNQIATIVSPDGFLAGAPARGGDIPAILRAAHRDGARHSAVWNSESIMFSGPGLTVLGRLADVPIIAGNDPGLLGPDDVFVYRRTDPQPGDPPPCATVLDGTAIYLFRGGDIAPFEDVKRLYCPTRTPAVYPGLGARGAASAPAEAPGIRRALRDELVAARRRGARQVVFESSLMLAPWFDGERGLRRLAQSAGLAVPVGMARRRLGPKDVTVFLRYRGQPNFPRPCVTVPNGGLFLVGGAAIPQAPEYADNLYCPSRNPPIYGGPLAG